MQNHQVLHSSEAALKTHGITPEGEAHRCNGMRGATTEIRRMTRATAAVSLRMCILQSSHRKRGLSPPFWLDVLHYELPIFIL